MPSLVLELQHDALDEKTAVSSLLRKAIAVARKLGVSDADHWLNHELNGYPKEADVPPYRVVLGEQRAKNPMRGDSMPVFDQAGKPKRGNFPIREPIASVESLTRDDGGETVIPGARPQ